MQTRHVNKPSEIPLGELPDRVPSKFGDKDERAISILDLLQEGVSWWAKVKYRDLTGEWTEEKVWVYKKGEKRFIVVYIGWSGSNEINEVFYLDALPIANAKPVHNVRKKGTRSKVTWQKAG